MGGAIRTLRMALQIILLTILETLSYLFLMTYAFKGITESASVLVLFGKESLYVHHGTQ